jgi:hypothetical protein
MVYVALLVFTYVFSVILSIAKIKDRKKISIGIFFLSITLLLTFRSESMGTDIPSYKFYFESFKHYFKWEKLFNINALLREDIEPLYVIITVMISKIFGNFRLYLAIIALLSIAPIWILYCNKADNPLLTVLLFLSFDPLVMYVSGIRQGLAMAFVPLAFYCVKEKKLWMFCLVVFLASLIHISALVTILMYPLYYLKLSNKKMCILVLMGGGIFYFRRQIYMIILSIVGKIITKMGKYGISVSSTGAYSFLLFLLVLLFFCFIIPDAKGLSQDDLGMRNYLVFCVFIQIFSSVSYLVMRFSLYYLLFMPILIPRIIKKSRRNYKVAKLIEFTLFVLLNIWFLYKVLSLKGAANSYAPYVFMWKG